MPLDSSRPHALSPRPLTVRQSAADFAAKGAAAKVALGWKETAKDLPSEAADKLKRAAHAVANPIETAQRKIDEIKANPLRAIMPIAMVAGGAALTALSPGLMRAVSIGLTASIVVVPTFRFAKSDSEDELLAIADGASKQIVDTAASYATSWAIGKVVRASLQKLQERKAHIGQAVAEGAEPIVTEGARAAEPDGVNFKALRNDRAAGRRFVSEVRTRVSDFHFEAWSKQNPGASRPQFDAWLATPEARPLRLQMVQDVRGVVHGEYLKLHGMRVPEGMAAGELAGVRRYVQDFDSTYDLADAIKGLNVGVDKGLRQANPLAIEGERFLFAERGVSAPYFSRFERAKLSGEELKRLRRFADAFATAEGGKYLKVASQQAELADVAALRSVMTRQMASDVGLIVPKQGVDDKTLLTLFSDLGREDQRNGREIVKVANEAFRQGKTSYYEINELANRRLLAGIGADPALLGKLEVGDEAFKAAMPRRDVAVARAEQVRLLRDRLRVLPDAQRAEAIGMLARGEANLLNFDDALTAQFKHQLAGMASGNAALVEKMTSHMTVQQKANFVSDVAGLPEGARARIFSGLSGTPEQMNKTVVDRLSGLIEQQFEVKVHRETGRFPIPDYDNDHHVNDWTVQGAAELFNGLNKMSHNGRSLESVKGTTFVYLTGSDPAGPGLVPFTFSRPGTPSTLYRPGSGHYQGGGMGFRTQVEGREFVVLYEAAMKMDNGSRSVGVSRAEGTVIHEIAHAAQLGGKPGAPLAQRLAEEQRFVKEWSALADWREADGTLADRYYTAAGKTRPYYKDPAHQVGARPTVVSSYGATDTVEDWAEFSRVFYHDPALALETSPEKFLYMNQFYQNHYGPDQTTALAHATGLGAEGLARAIASLRTKLSAVPGADVGLVARLVARLRAA